jgi:anthranilate phosphoribosyltransferase
VLEALGVNINLRRKGRRAIEEVGVGFMFAPNTTAR